MAVFQDLSGDCYLYRSVCGLRAEYMPYREVVGAPSKSTRAKGSGAVVWTQPEVEYARFGVAPT